MSPLHSTQHRAGKPGDDPVAEIEKDGLLLGNVEFQIEQHLLTHGTRLAPETRWFLAQVRDALGTAFRDSVVSLARNETDRKRPSRSAVQTVERELLEIASARLETRSEGADYPGPREAAAAPVITSLDPKAIAAAEGALELSLRDRRQIQRRLGLAGFDPKIVDGIIGPATRAAIREWQAASGSLPSGYLEERSLATLKLETEEKYRGWRVAERARRAAEATRTAALASPLPSVSPESARRCQRVSSGEILYGQNFRCDFRGLKENIAQLFRGARRPADAAG